jgi:hypothetical protein
MMSSHSSPAGRLKICCVKLSAGHDVHPAQGS